MSDIYEVVRDMIDASGKKLKDVAEDTGKDPSTFRREVNRFDSGAKLGIEMLIPIMRSTGRHDILQYLAERMGYRLVNLAGAAPDKPTVTEELLGTYPAVTGFHQAIQDKQPLQAVGFLLEQATGELEQDFVAYRSTLAGQKGGK